MKDISRIAAYKEEKRRPTKAKVRHFRSSRSSKANTQKAMAAEEHYRNKIGCTIHRSIIQRRYRSGLPEDKKKRVLTALIFNFDSIFTVP